MKYITFLSIFLSFYSCGQSKRDQLDKVFMKLSKDGKYDGVALIYKGGHILLYGGYGFKDIQKKIINDTNTVFQIGSLTKQFTAEIVLKLVNDKKIELSDRLSKYLPTYPHGDSISVYNLLTHTSGIYDYTENIDSLIIDPRNGIEEQQLIDLFKNKPLAFSPGSKFSYSNSNYILLGNIIEIVTKSSYQKILRKEIFSKAEMTHSGFDFSHLTDTNKAIAYKLIDNKFQVGVNYDSSFSFAAGSIYSTGRDMLNWYLALHQNKLLPKNVQDKMYIPFLNNYSMGWALNESRHKKFYYHSGKIGGFSSFELQNPQDDLYILFLENHIDDQLNNNKIVANVLDIIYK